MISTGYFLTIRSHGDWYSTGDALAMQVTSSDSTKPLEAPRYTNGGLTEQETDSSSGSHKMLKATPGLV